MGRIDRGVRGIGDTRFWGEYAWSVGDEADDSGWTLSAGLGLAVPTGDPERPQVVGGVPSSTLQTGTGTWDPFGRLAVGRGFGDVTGFAVLETTVPLMENRFDYRPGTSGRLSIGAQVPLNDTFSLVPSLSTLIQDVDRVRGRRLFASGGHWLYGGLQVEAHLSEAISLWAGAEAPLLRDLVTPTLESDVRGAFGVTFEF